MTPGRLEDGGGDFTPWLAGEENLALLGGTIVLEIELEAQEKAREYIRRAPKKSINTPPETTGPKWLA